ncbi:geminin [Zophobas morio]|uniref:geminin n=1 Tax=Zophobas morio TaxID=2755281 RepID=UPI003083184E
MKTGIKLDSQDQKENTKTTRNALKLLQHTAADKENLAGRLHEKDKLASSSYRNDHKRKPSEDKAVQTGESVITAADLTSDEPSADYWKRVAEKRQEMLDESLTENEKLKGAVEALQEENKACKEMLDESRALVEVLQEMLAEDDGNGTTEAAEED